MPKKNTEKKEKTSYINFFCDVTKQTTELLASSVKNAIEQQFDKITIRLAPREKELFSELQEVVELRKKNIINDDDIIIIKYKSDFSGKTTERQISNISVKKPFDGKLTIFAFCHLTGAIETFSLNNILDIKFNGDTIDKNIFFYTYFECILCPTCANLEIWQSHLHDVKQKACSLRKLLIPKEIECSFYVGKGKQGSSYLCRSCKYLDVWVSSGKEITSEVCSFRQIILPSKTVCEYYNGKK